jgi:hypothetical protein
MQTSTILRLVILGDKHCTCSAMSALRAPKNIQRGQFIVLVSSIVARRYSSQLVGFNYKVDAYIFCLQSLIAFLLVVRPAPLDLLPAFHQQDKDEILELFVSLNEF